MQDEQSKSSGGVGIFVFLLLLLLVGGLGYLGYSMMSGGGTQNPGTPNGSSTVSTPSGGGATSPGTPATGGGATTQPPADKQVEINIAYGTEKKRWLLWALDEFEKTPAGRRIKVNLKGMGSVEGARAVVNGPGDFPIHVWSPASSLFRDVFETEWELKHNTKDVVLRGEDLALSPMVFVMWKARHDEFQGKYHHPLDFDTIAQGMQEPGGWNTICNKPEWGLFKFGHTNPSQSNSGLMTLVLLAYSFNQKKTDLSMADITSAEFQGWLKSFETGVAKPGGQLIHSTGTLMETMVKRGPSYYDCVMVYENLAIDYMKFAEGRWGQLHVTYPKYNAWNENPYYILDVPWSSAEQRSAANEFLDFLMSERIQSEALKHGFRPGNVAVPIKFPESPFVKYEKYGLKIDVLSVCDPPKAAVLENLLASFERIQ